MNLINYSAPNKNLWQGRKSASEKEYVHERIQFINLENEQSILIEPKSIAFVGFNCDAGIVRNHGRAGAKDGPNAIRNVFGKMAWHFSETLNIYDLGNIECHNDELEMAQSMLAEVARFARLNEFQLIILGGGHETAWGHYQGLQQAHPDKHIGIINFDAHFDLRELLPGNKGTSGTPFLQIAKYCKDKQKQFSYFVLGIQESANAQSLFQVANQLGVEYITAFELFTNKTSLYEDKLNKFIESIDGVYLTFCLDVMSQAIAPGVSAPQANGLFLAQVLPLLKIILKNKKLLGFDIVELSPPFDRDQATARLAANIIYEVIKDLSITN